MTIIAIEEHWSTPELAKALKDLPDRERDDSLALNEMGDNLRRLEDLDDTRLATMDEQGIDIQVLSVAPPGPGALAPGNAVAISRDMNDVAADAVRRHPDRFRAMATLPMAEPSAVAGELERAAGLGFVGAMVYGRTGDTPLDDIRYDDMFASAAALGMPIFIHPQIPTAAIRQASYSGFDPLTELALSTFSWGWHVEAAISALRLIARGTLDRHPELQIILGHWGELILFWEDRLKSLSRTAGLERPFLEYIQSNLFVTSSGMLNPALLRHVLTVTSVERLLFSTDYPFQQPTRPDIEQFLQEFETDRDRTLFTHKNAQDLFGIVDSALATTNPTFPADTEGR